MDRGEVIWVDRSYETLWDVRPKMERETRLALCLLPRSFAQALRTQTVLFGTTRRSSNPAGGTTAARALEFAHCWQDADGVWANVWKGYNLDVVDGLRRGDGTALPDWEKSCSRRIAGLLADETYASRLFRGRLNSTSVVRGIKAGSLLHFGGHTVCVLSNEVIHDCHPYGLLIVAPLIYASPLAQLPGAVPWGTARIAYEFAQRIEPRQGLFSIVEEDPLERGIIATARDCLQRFLADTTPVRVDRTPFLEYLRRSREEFDERRLPVNFGTPSGGGDPAGGPRPSIQKTRRVPGGSRGLTDLEPSIGGRDLVALALGLELFEAWVDRDGPLVSIVLEPKALADNEIEHAWVVGGDGRVTATLSRSKVDGSGVFRLPIGRATPETSTRCVVGVSGPLGGEEFEVDFSWQR